MHFLLLSAYEIEICAIHPEAVFCDRVNALYKFLLHQLSGIVVYVAK
jgi:hypothetical protein